MKTNSRHALLCASAALLMLAGAPANAETDVAGVTAAVNPKATAFDGAGKPRLISLGDPVIRNHRIETSGEGLVQILLADGTSFTVGPNSSVVIDNFVYDPNKNTASLAATMTKGALRFIGGKASKASGSVKIDTPIGTAGIRGAVVDINLNGQTSDGQPLPPHMTLVYGKEVELTGNGSPQRLFRQGFSIVAGDGQPRVQRTPPQWVSGLQQVLAGRPGTGGGASKVPTDQTVSKSPVSQTNSAQLPSANAIPVPTPRPITTAPVENIAGDSQRDVGTRPEVPTDNGIAVSVLSPKGVTGDVPPMAPPGGSSGDLRLGASRGTLTRNADGTLSGTDAVGNAFTLPALAATNVFTEQLVSAVVNGVAVSGTAYTGSGGFFTYMLAAEDDEPEAFYVIGGTPADARDTLSSGEILSYALEPDLLAALVNSGGQTIPFTGSFNGEAGAAAVASDLLIGGVSDTTGGVAGRALQASLVISGSGSSQSSAINVFTGSVKSLTGGGYGLVASTAGSSRTDAFNYSTHNQGIAGSIGSTAGKDHFLGADGEYLVIGSGSIETMDFSYEQSEFDGYEQVHVAKRDDSVSLSKTTSLSGQQATGFISGVYTQYGSDVLMTGRAVVTADAASASFEGRFTSMGGDEYADFYTEDANSTYLSDQLMAATNSDQGSYMVSSEVVPSNLFGGSQPNQICNACEFMTWGWWGRNSVGEVPYEVHLGNWIIGKQPENSAVPTSGTATYNGNAVGTVVNAGAQYIATGNLSAEMNFGTRTGKIEISGYDGRNDVFGAHVSFASGSNAVSTLTSTSMIGIATSVTGAFASNGTDPVKGIMGNFRAVDGTWSSSGIFAGSR